MAAPLAGKTVGCLIDFQYEDLEVWFPKLRLEEAGAKVVIVGSHPKGMKYTGKFGYPAVSDKSIGDVDLDEFDALVIPGGFAPDYFRRDQKMKDLVCHMFKKQKPMASICHGPWMFCSAKIDGKPVISGVRCTCFSAIRDDVENAGGIFEDAAVVIDKKVITSRTPADLVPFVQAIISELS
eukprot:TRINITY_DN5412_c2_g1_i1.p1 TRINITY_DN5412_c2_g1~~TRINITY_DN5412_c2_g1_i1.p1  ORF type:complete len:201 (+),score=41.45 TRINITY_DN5412_c2_g1_i1:63-605(+)